MDDNTPVTKAVLKIELRAELDVVVHNIARLITDTKESLEREMHAGFGEISARFDVQEARLERHAALLQTGSRWTNCMKPVE